MARGGAGAWGCGAFAVALWGSVHLMSVVAPLGWRTGMAGMVMAVVCSVASEAVPSLPTAEHPVMPCLPVQTL